MTNLQVYGGHATCFSCPAPAEWAYVLYGNPDGPQTWWYCEAHKPTLVGSGSLMTKDEWEREFLWLGNRTDGAVAGGHDIAVNSGLVSEARSLLEDLDEVMVAIETILGRPHSLRPRIHHVSQHLKFALKRAGLVIEVGG